MSPEVSQIITAALSLITAFLVWKARGDIKQVHTTFNSKMDKLLLITENEAVARGKLEGRAEAVAESNARAAATVPGEKPAPVATDPEKVEVVITGDAVQVTTAEKPKESK